MIIWLIGLAGSGKTTIGRALFSRMKATWPNTILLDGDGIREVMGNDLGYSQADREKNGWRLCRLGKYLADQGQHVIVCILSNFPEQRAWNRTHVADYHEVYIRVPLETLRARNQKGLYEGSSEGVVGLDIPFHEPESPDLVLENTVEQTDFAPLAEAVLESIRARGISLT
jgi:adenylylsulfate kinase